MAGVISCLDASLPISRRLLGKVALVTGGANGIGEAIVRVFHKHGAKICIVDIDDEVGQHLSDHLGGDQNTIFFHCDVTKEDEITQAINFTVEKFGSLDIMVNNAGTADPPNKDIRETEISVFDKVFDVNVKGVFLGMKHAARVMIPNKKGCIISTCSAASAMAGVAPHAYTGSKHAVVGLTKSVAGELGQYGIRVNCVSPYAILTKLALPLVPNGESEASFRQVMAKNANLQGIELTVEDVANAVLFLASDEARYISGDNLMLDGGFCAVNHCFNIFRSD